MDFDGLKRLIELFNDGGLTLLRLKGVEGDFEEIVLKKEPTAAPEAVPAPRPAAEEPEASPTPETTPVRPAVSEGELVYVEAPLVGTFYPAPSPESPPYVKVGDRVEKGTIVCIVEAMKVMNEIESEYAGTIARVLVENAQPVEYGQRMFAVKPD
ncbi:MAG TPA: acetyl-CoA carboxylase biotin carboxyl carrier protein [Candidatus Coatesbacteria bacterium]|nr:acetyl-CoA carboxylase biotin carboxyl carrier protein [Candidatus Coatesbacteria bacterium]